jgi:hypothetical protein
MSPITSDRNPANAERARVERSSWWDTVKLFAGVAVDLAAKHVEGEAIKAGVPPRMLDFSRSLELGWARKAFLAGTTGAPFDPPTDPADQAEWERGEAMAAVVILADMTSGGVMPPGQLPQAAPVAGVVRGNAAAVPATVPLGPPVYAASKKREDTRATKESRGSPPTERSTHFGYKGSLKWRNALKELMQPGPHETIAGEVPTREEATQMIRESGGTIQRGAAGEPMEPGEQFGHEPGGVSEHTYPHINYETPSGVKATVKVQP